MSLRKLVKYTKKVAEKGLVTGTGGNTSLQEDDSIYMSPHGLSLQEIEEDDFVKIDPKTERVLEGEKQPTSEWKTHLAIYRKKFNAKAIIHAHPPHLIALLSAGEDLRPITPEHAIFLGKATTLPYITPGGKELALAIGKKALKSDIFLLRNHGVIVSGKNAKEAFRKVELVEGAARIQVLALRIGQPRLLTEKEISKVKNLDMKMEIFRKNR